MADWYELVGVSGSGKTTLATLACQKYEATLWLAAPQEEPQGIFDAVGHWPSEVNEVRKVAVAFAFMKEAQHDFDLIVLDSLAGLEPTHPSASRIAPDVRKGWFGNPACPILVTNQLRHPHPPGGATWRAVVKTKRLALYRRRPCLLSRLDDRWLVWWPGGKPELRTLSYKEELFVDDSRKRDGSIDTPEAGAVPARRSWLL